jgi:carbon storage regulator
MLVITRKLSEKIDIMDGLVQVQVVQVKGKQVRLGITCPPEVAVHRAECSEAERKERHEQWMKTQKRKLPSP